MCCYGTQVLLLWPRPGPVKAPFRSSVTVCCKGSNSNCKVKIGHRQPKALFLEWRAMQINAYQSRTLSIFLKFIKTESIPPGKQIIHWPMPPCDINKHKRDKISSRLKTGTARRVMTCAKYKTTTYQSNSIYLYACSNPSYNDSTRIFSGPSRAIKMYGSYYTTENLGWLRSF